MVCGRLRRRWRGGKQGFGVRGEVLGTIRGVETFGEHDEGCARAGGFEDMSAGAGEVGRFVGAWGSWELGFVRREELERIEEYTCGKLDKSQFQGLLEKTGHDWF